MEQHTLKNVNNCSSTKFYFFLETLGGQNFNWYLNIVHFFNTNVNWTSVSAEGSFFLHRCQIRTVCYNKWNILVPLHLKGKFPKRQWDLS